MPLRSTDPSPQDDRASRVRKALGRVNPARLLPSTRARRRGVAAPTIRGARGRAARPAPERPTTSRVPKWDWEDRQRDVVLAVAGILAVVIVAVLGFGYWRENVARGSEVVATAYGSSTTLNDLVPWTKPRVTSLQQTIEIGRASCREKV